MRCNSMQKLLEFCLACFYYAFSKRVVMCVQVYMHKCSKLYIAPFEIVFFFASACQVKWIQMENLQENDTFYLTQNGKICMFFSQVLYCTRVNSISVYTLALSHFVIIYFFLTWPHSFWCSFTTFSRVALIFSFFLTLYRECREKVK